MRAYFVAVATFACAYAVHAQIPAPRTRDSAGIRIVENATIKTTLVAFTIAEKPTLDLGGLKDDPREEFDSGSPFLTAKRLSDGRVVTTDNSSLKMFSATGQLVRILGRRGNGPGEFNQLLDVCLAPGDTIVAVPYGLPRLSVFDSAGRHVRTFATAGYPWTDPCFSDGSVLFRTKTEIDPAFKVVTAIVNTYDRVVTVARYSPHDTPGSTIGRFPAGSDQPIRLYGNVVVHRDTLFVGDGQTQKIDVYSAKGRFVRSIRWLDALVPMTDQFFSAHMGFAPGKGATREQVAQFNEQVRNAPKPAYIPAYGQIKIDALGRVWVQDYSRTSKEPKGWTVFDATGRVLGRATLPRLPTANPAYTELMDIGPDYVVLSWRDTDNGAAHVSFHSLIPPTR